MSRCLRSVVGVVVLFVGRGFGTGRKMGVEVLVEDVEDALDREAMVSVRELGAGTGAAALMDRSVVVERKSIEMMEIIVDGMMGLKCDDLVCRHEVRLFICTDIRNGGAGMRACLALR